jgi:hypothetical protein
MNKNDAVRYKVLDYILDGATSVPSVRAKYCGKGKIIHMRFCSSSGVNSHLYKFNINPNTLTADYEVWIYGSAS